jgi:hypothetical protein
MSMPPIVKWRYDWHPEAGTPEARLYSDFLRVRDWVAAEAGASGAAGAAGAAGEAGARPGQ